MSSPAVSESAYVRLATGFARIARYDHLAALAEWDKEVVMPVGAMHGRAEVMAELAILRRERLTDPAVAADLAAARSEALSPDQRANLREMQRAHDRVQALGPDLIEAQSLAAARCERGWRDQRPANDWVGFRDNLRVVVELAREEAAARAVPGQAEPYDALLEGFEPGMTASRLDGLFADVRVWLPDLLAEVVARQRLETHAAMPAGPFEEISQMALGERVMQGLGFDFARGRLDRSLHPFSCGTPDDARITTRLHETDVLASLLPTIHETGHACYEQNRPSGWQKQPLGAARSAGVHEAQSLFFEMQLARSPAFIAWLKPLIDERFPAYASVSEQDMIAHVQRVAPGRIRVDADEVSYTLHILLRYEIERRLINRDIEVDDIPGLWDERMQSWLGLDTQGDHRDGCMQDIHWSLGLFGYFPSYSLGAMLAAQLMAAIRAGNPGLDRRIAAGDFRRFTEALSARVWQQGSRLETPALIRHATGADLDPAGFRAHLTARYLG